MKLELRRDVVDVLVATIIGLVMIAVVAGAMVWGW
jgi:hypothetical protein